MREGDFFAFMKERESVRLKKAAGHPFPWTDDPILREYKFTNIKRDHDRTTIEFKKIYDLNKDAPVALKLLNCAIARYFGRWEFLYAIGFQTDFRPEHLKRMAIERAAAKLPVFTGAYIITNMGIKARKSDTVVDHFLTALWDHSIVLAGLIGKGSWQPVIEELMQVRGFGGSGFMAKEVILDTILAGAWPGGGNPADFNEWCPLGPGARRGATRVAGADNVDKVLSETDSREVMMQLFDIRHQHWPENFVELVLHDIQFQLCEFDKYERVRLGQGRPRSKYRVRTTA